VDVWDEAECPGVSGGYFTSCACDECCSASSNENVDIFVTCGVGDYDFAAVSSASTVSVGTDA